jgi:hypothetical protein
MKSTIKFLLVIALFCSTVFADGNMNNGGKTCTSNCFAAPQDTEATKTDTDQNESNDSILDFVKDYLFSILG